MLTTPLLGPPPQELVVVLFQFSDNRVGLLYERVEGIQNLKMKERRVDNHIQNNAISYLAKYEPLAFRRLKVRKNFGNSSSLIFNTVISRMVSLPRG